MHLHSHSNSFWGCSTPSCISASASRPPSTHVICYAMSSQINIAAKNVSSLYTEARPLLVRYRIFYDIILLYHIYMYTKTTVYSKSLSLKPYSNFAYFTHIAAPQNVPLCTTFLHVCTPLNITTHTNAPTLQNVQTRRDNALFFITSYCSDTHVYIYTRVCMCLTTITPLHGLHVIPVEISTHAP